MAGDSTISLHDFLSGYLVPGGKWYSATRSYARKTAPGTGVNGTFDYSNIGASFCAYVIECAAQQQGSITQSQTYDDFVLKFIFAPLGVTNA
eukprot:gene15022-22281_t